MAGFLRCSWNQLAHQLGAVSALPSCCQILQLDVKAELLFHLEIWYQLNSPRGSWGQGHVHVWQPCAKGNSCGDFDHLIWRSISTTGVQLSDGLSSAAACKGVWPSPSRADTKVASVPCVMLWRSFMAATWPPAAAMWKATRPSPSGIRRFAPAKLGCEIAASWYTLLDIDVLRNMKAQDLQNKLSTSKYPLVPLLPSTAFYHLPIRLNLALNSQILSTSQPCLCQTPFRFQSG